MSGHGWVVANRDGTRARCGGPALCSACRDEAARLGIAVAAHPAQAKARPVDEIERSYLDRITGRLAILASTAAVLMALRSALL